MPPSLVRSADEYPNSDIQQAIKTVNDVIIEKVNHDHQID
jgi:hypothetical protein